MVVGDAIHYAIERKDPLVAEHETFRDAVRSGRFDRTVTLEEGLRALRVGEAIIVSARSDTYLPAKSGWRYRPGSGRTAPPAEHHGCGSLTGRGRSEQKAGRVRSPSCGAPTRRPPRP